MIDLPIWLKLTVTLVFVVLNGFFVAAEFALVTVRAGRVDALAEQGNRRAAATQRILRQLDLYLSGCQLGITVASLVLGWLAEPAVASLIIGAAERLGWAVGNGPILHAVALAIALATVTMLHMTLGEQAPKIWALKRSSTVSLLVAYPLTLFVTVFRPLIWAVNQISNGMLRLVGIRSGGGHEHIPDVEELKRVLQASATAGEISPRQKLFAKNVLGLINLEVRHVMLPRVDVQYMSLQSTLDENLQILRESGHSRFPLCEVGLDTVVGIVLSRDLLGALLADEPLDLQRLARPPLVVPDTQPLPQFILEAQGKGTHCAVVLDEHGTAVGLVFLEDALEKIVGPIRDEFDLATPLEKELPDGALEFSGSRPLPEVADALGISFDEDTDTVGGYFAARLGRLPVQGDQLRIMQFKATVVGATGQRVTAVRFERESELSLETDEDGED